MGPFDSFVALVVVLLAVVPSVVVVVVAAASMKSIPPTKVFPSSTHREA
jgi:hypothetical protein